MRNLGKTIEELIKVDPALETTLSFIKDKWEKYPKKKDYYWKKLLEILNSDTIQNHPKRSEMKDILHPKKKLFKKGFFFDQITPKDQFVGVIPENILDLILRSNVRALKIAKLGVEANMTRDSDLMAEVRRKEYLLSTDTRKIWLLIRDYFDLWKSSSEYTIKIREHFHVLTKNPQTQPPQFVGPGLVKMDQITLKRFMDFLNSEEQ